MSREDKERLRGVLVFNPGFFFGEILRAFEIRACSQSAESESLHGVDELLHRCRNSRVGKKEGSGLGLAAVHRIVDLHGGWIKVESQERHGSRFVVCMPRSGDAGMRLWHEGRTPWKRS
ncbi:MAG: ATP-binding protein [Nitrospira sp.]|nr:MAG: ATP-binding protein [Nitrospira sp.]